MHDSDSAATSKNCAQARLTTRPRSSVEPSQGFRLAPPLVGLPKRKLASIRGMTRIELEAWVSKLPGLNVPRFRTQQVFGWLHRQRVTDFDAMSNLPRDFRDALKKYAGLPELGQSTAQCGADGTRKLRLETEDGHAIESVLIPNAERGYTQCVSSQVGCAVDCQFCATASLGLIRNLESWEIVAQVYQARRLLEDVARDAGDRWPGRITNLVFMGMGEPLHNYNQVRRAIEILTDDQGDPISGRRITVSTSGLVPAIERFAQEELGRDVGLAISLNATTDAIRDEIMPINRRWNIETLLDAVRRVPQQKRRRITFEYVLLGGVNDSDADAARLARLIGDFHCHVNVIPFNPHPHAAYRRPEKHRIDAFMEICRQRRLDCYLRTPRGDDIDAACGQLALTPPRG